MPYVRYVLFIHHPLCLKKCSKQVCMLSVRLRSWFPKNNILLTLILNLRLNITHVYTIIRNKPHLILNIQALLSI